MTHMTHTDYNVLELMRTHGGGFAAALAEAWMRADSLNNTRMHEAFGGLYHTYARMCAARENV